MIKKLSAFLLKTWQTIHVLYRNTLKGDLVNFDTAKFELSNMEERNVSMRSICKPEKPMHYLMSSALSFKESVSRCKKMRGTMSVIRDLETMRRFQDVAMEHPNCMSNSVFDKARFWAGWSDNMEEGVFRDANDGEALADG